MTKLNGELAFEKSTTQILQQELETLREEVDTLKITHNGRITSLNQLYADLDFEYRLLRGALESCEIERPADINASTKNADQEQIKQINQLLLKAESEINRRIRLMDTSAEDKEHDMSTIQTLRQEMDTMNRTHERELRILNEQLVGSEVKNKKQMQVIESCEIELKLLHSENSRCKLK